MWKPLIYNQSVRSIGKSLGLQLTSEAEDSLMRLSRLIVQSELFVNVDKPTHTHAHTHTLKLDLRILSISKLILLSNGNHTLEIRYVDITLQSQVIRIGYLSKHWKKGKDHEDVKFGDAIDILASSKEHL